MPFASDYGEPLEPPTLNGVGPCASMEAVKPSLLYISPRMPRPTGSGSSIRAYQMIRALSRRYEVHLLVVECYEPATTVDSMTSSLCREVLIDPLRFDDYLFMVLRHAWLTAGLGASRPAEWAYLPRRRISRLSRLLSGRVFNVVHFFRLHLTPLLEVVNSITPRPSLWLDLDDIESLSRTRMATIAATRQWRLHARFLRLEAARYCRLERQILPRFDRVFVCSETDRDRLLEDHELLDVIVAFNVVDVPVAMASRPPGRHPNTFVFIGSLGYLPNRDAVVFFAQQVWPAVYAGLSGNARFLVVGQGLPQCDSRHLAGKPGIELLGPVPNVTEVYQSADIAVVPLRAGSGTRVKVLEAFAHGVPVIGTSLGLEGLPVHHGIEALVADSPKELAEACLRLVSDRRLSERLSHSARCLVLERFGTQNLSWALEPRESRSLSVSGGIH